MEKIPAASGSVSGTTSVASERAVFTGVDQRPHILQRNRLQGLEVYFRGLDLELFYDSAAAISIAGMAR
jgi:hypothetical protein